MIGASARSRDIPLEAVNPRESASLIAKQNEGAQIAIVFGREHAGLTNEELLKCHRHLYIPSNPNYASLNLAAAVQVVAYECRMAVQARDEAFMKSYDSVASFEEVERFYTHLKDVLEDINFLRPKSPKRLMERIRRMFNRIRLEQMEVNILRGILSAVQNKND